MNQSFKDRIKNSRSLWKSGNTERALELLEREPMAGSVLVRAMFFALKADILSSLERYIDSARLYEKALTIGREWLPSEEKYRIELQLAGSYNMLGLFVRSYQLFSRLYELGHEQANEIFTARSAFGKAASLYNLWDNPRYENEAGALNMDPTATAILKTIQELLGVALPIFVRAEAMQVYSIVYLLALMHESWFNLELAAELRELLAHQRQYTQSRVVNISYYKGFIERKEIKPGEIEAFCDAIDDPLIGSIILDFIASQLMQANPQDDLILLLVQRSVKVLEKTQHIGQRMFNLEFAIHFLSHHTQEEGVVAKMTEELRTLKELLKVFAVK